MVDSISPALNFVLNPRRQCGCGSFLMKMEVWSENILLNLPIQLQLLGLGSTDIKMPKDKFYNQIFNILNEISLLNPPISTKQVINEPLWLNNFVTINEYGKPRSIYMKNWYMAGFHTISDLWNFQENCWKSKRELSEKIHLFTPLQYKRVMSAVSIFEPSLQNSNVNDVNVLPKIRCNDGWKELSKLTSKFVYGLLILNKKTRPTSEAKIQTWFNENIDWKFVYNSAKSITNNAYMLQIYFKLSHNILPTNEKLFEWKKIQRPHCLCGIVDTNLHYTVQCKLIQPFWEKITLFIKNILNVRFPLTDTEKYFGIPNPQNLEVLDAINYIFLACKVFIWKEKRLGKPCALFDFLPFLREQLLIEAATKTFRKKAFVQELIDSF